MEQRKLSKTASILDKLALILQIIAIVGLVGMIAAGIFMLCLRDTLPGLEDSLSLSLSFGNLTLKTVEGTTLTDASTIVGSSLLSLLSAAVLAGLVWFGLRIVRQILKPMKAGEPFLSGISKKIRILGILVLIFGIISNIFGAVSMGLMYSAIDLSKLFNPQVVEQYTIESRFDLGFVIVALALFLLAYVFRYGEALQKEADETL